MILAIDPGTYASGIVLLDGLNVNHATEDLSNTALDALIETLPKGSHIVVEDYVPRAEPFGHDVHKTIKLIEYLRYHVLWRTEHKFCSITRQDVKMHLTGRNGSKDAEVWSIVKDRYGGDIATKPKGALRGLKKHAQQAMALAITYLETSGLKCEGCSKVNPASTHYKSFEHPEVITPLSPATFSTG